MTHQLITPLAAALTLLMAGPALAARNVPQISIAAADKANPYLPVTIKDASLKIRVGLAFDSIVLLNPAAAQRTGLKPFPLIGKGSIKNAAIPGGKAVFRFAIAGVTPAGVPRSRLPTVWLDIPAAADADGVMAVGQIKADRIEFILRDTPPGSSTLAIPKKGSGEAGITARIGDEEVTVSLELNNPTTMMNARAGVALLEAGLATRQPEIGYWRPLPTIALPVQTLAPRSGLTIAGLPMRRMAMRVSEADARRVDASARGTSTPEDDEDTITVSADRKKKGGRAPWILVGRDVLDDCSRIVFDRPGKRWLLTCKFN